jgi:hypothetical protein
LIVNILRTACPGKEALPFRRYPGHCIPLTISHHFRAIWQVVHVAVGHKFSGFRLPGHDAAFVVVCAPEIHATPVERTTRVDDLPRTTMVHSR